MGSFSFKPSMWYRALAVVGVLYGSFFLLSDRAGGSARGGNRAAELALLSSPPSQVHHDLAVDNVWQSPPTDRPRPPGDPSNAWKDHNFAALQALMGCLAAHTCTDHQTKVVILQDEIYRTAHEEPVGGEKIWARAVLTTLDLLGVTYFYSTDNNHLVWYYNLFPNLIRAAIVNPWDVNACWEQTWGDDCLKTSANPLGVRIQGTTTKTSPSSHLFTPEFFGSQGSTPLGAEWALTPEDYGGKDTYLGYSIQTECMSRNVPPHPTRPRRVWILAKQARYFTGVNSPISDTTLVRAAEELDIEFVSAYTSEPDERPFPGVTNLGKLLKPEFEKEIVNSLAIVGLGDPVVSPTPWFGLCWSLPFLNPSITHTDADGVIHVDQTQHSGTYKVGEPHVYNFPPHDDAAFIAALRKAIQPHERFIPFAMTQAEMSRRTLAWLDRDWKAVAEHKLASDEFKDRYTDKDFLL